VGASINNLKELGKKDYRISSLLFYEKKESFSIKLEDLA